MLLRTAGRRQRPGSSHVLAASFAQLNLPWLAPAQLRWTASQAPASAAAATSPSLRSRRHSTSKQQQSQSRHLATAADQYTTSTPRFEPPPGYNTVFRNSNQDKNVPWDSSTGGKRESSAVRPHKDPIIINTTTQTPAPMIKLSNGLQGTSLELLQHLHTCLRVGRVDRADAIMRRLTEQVSNSSPELLHAHTIYLEAKLTKLATLPLGTDASETAMKEIQRWYEVEVRGKGLKPDGKLLVVMVRTAIRNADDTVCDNYIRNYAEMARNIGEDTLDDVLYSEEYDDHEFMVLGRATADYYEEAEQDLIAQNAREVFLLPEESDAQLSTANQQAREQLSLDDVPEVLATNQKGGGLSGIKKAMDVLVDSAKLPADMSAEAKKERLVERQTLMEETAVDIAVDQWREADEELRKIGIHTSMQSKPVGALMWQWLQTLLPVLREELAEVKKALKNPTKSDHERNHYGPYLELVSLDKIAATTILHTMTMITSAKSQKPSAIELAQTQGEQQHHDVKLTHLTTGLGKAIEQESGFEAMKGKTSKKALSQREFMRRKREASKKARGKGSQQTTTQDGLQSLVGEEKNWPLSVRIKLGAMLVSKLIETAQLPVTRMHPRTQEKITQLQPAFLHRVKYTMGKKVGTLAPNPALIGKIETEPIASLIAKRMPMIVEPKPWSGWNEGGYLRYSTPIMRLAPGDKSGRAYFHAAQQENGLDQVFDGLNALSKVPWRVNHDVFKVQLEAWNSGEEVANFAPLNPEFDVPPEPEASADPNTKRRWLNNLREMENKRTGLHSKRCFQNFQLEIARSVVNETLYFPHNLDFRGRAYPIPPYLNHMGADNVRALVVFDEGKELGPDGLRWLKIHLATVAGHDKASLDERIEFTTEHMEDIYDSVKDPLGGKRWWLKAEDAWQTLAACFELTKAIDSPDPSKFISHLPIHQDGTCNGLQHYAALGGDEIGARQVNLEPGDRPADVYTAVAEAVKEEVRKDAEAGNIVAQKLHGRITRKCVKQPVMTNVYGVTFYGAKAQVRKQLEVLFPEVGMYDTPNLGQMSHYIATKIFQSLGTMFGGAQSIQTWLGQCADRISTCLTPEQIKQLTAANAEVASEPAAAKPSRKTKGKQATKATKAKTADATRAQEDTVKRMFKSTVVWTTPLSLPVVQPYRTSKSKTVKTNMQRVTLQDPQVWDPVSKRKQLQAFPPNFIHSLDATHMLLSAVKCTENGLTFASIHDSFWTHACDISRMSSLLRDAFVDMHSDDIVGRLREEFQTRYKGCMHLASVLTNGPVGQQIAAHRRARKTAGSPETGELAQEVERLRLLDSADPEERKAGEEMITPGSIFASHSSSGGEHAAPLEMAGQQLGDIPNSAEINPGTAEVSETVPATAEAGAEPVERKAINRNVNKTFVWLPISFPEVPQKGSFDVRRLRESKYFFH